MSDVRLFTVEEAERTLPLVRKILADMDREYPAWEAALRQYEALSAGLQGSKGEPPELVETRCDVTARATAVQGLLRELESIGCHLKSVGAGLVDFHSLKDDRVVLLCWQRDEPHIAHWHEVDAGFANRQPIVDHHFTSVDS